MNGKLHCGVDDQLDGVNVHEIEGFKLVPGGWFLSWGGKMAKDLGFKLEIEVGAGSFKNERGKRGRGLKDQKAIQLKALVTSGLTVEEAAESLGLEPDAALDFLSGELNREEISADEYRNSKKLRMWQVLFEIANDPTGENVSARVAAARAFVDTKGEEPEIPVDKLSEYYRKMKDVVTKQRENPISITNPSPSTTVVDIKSKPQTKSDIKNPIDNAK